MGDPVLWTVEYTNIKIVPALTVYNLKYRYMEGFTQWEMLK